MTGYRTHDKFHINRIQKKISKGDLGQRDSQFACSGHRGREFVVGAGVRAADAGAAASVVVLVDGLWSMEKKPSSDADRHPVLDPHLFLLLSGSVGVPLLSPSLFLLLLLAPP